MHKTRDIGLIRQNRKPKYIVRPSFLMCHGQCNDRPNIIRKLSYRSERGNSIVSLYVFLRLTGYMNLFSYLVFVPQTDTMRTVISCPDVLTNLSLMSWCTNREQVFREVCKWEKVISDVPVDRLQMLWKSCPGHWWFKIRLWINK